MRITLEQLNEKEYLGDGAFVGHSQGQVWVIAHDGYRTTDAVCIEPGAAEETLLKYLTNIQERRRGAG